MDIMLLTYLENRYETITDIERRTFVEFLEEADLDMLSWITGRTTPHEKYCALIQSLRSLNIVGV